MKKITTALLLILLILGSGCNDGAGLTPASEVPVEEPAPSSTEPLATAPLATDIPPSATETRATAGEESPATEQVAEYPAPDEAWASPEPVILDPSLFPGSWDDRDIYLSGLIPDETSVLDDLSGATVYHMNLDITDPTMVTGMMEARYTNQEDRALDELVLHLFAPSLGGGIDLSDILLDGKTADSQIDGGTLRVTLDTPLEPGEQAVLSLNFATAVPGEESTKYKVLAFDQNILALAHFYPMFAVFDEHGWHDEPTADHGDETFADMSFYLVQVDARADQVIAATGVDVGGEGSDTFRRVTYAAGPVRDFYLAASDDFDVVQRQVGPLLLNSYAPSDLMDGAQLALDVAARSLESFSKRYGTYPYSELDIVSTPTDALGIEYPGIFANAVRIYELSSGSSSGMPNATLLESTTAHETGHQWFYNLVGNDQLNEPWLDEATTQYATWQYYVDSYGEQNAQGYYDSLEGRWGRVNFEEMPIGLPAHAYTGAEYGAIVYGRGPIFLNELAEQMGQDVFDEFMRDYVEQYRWQIAYADDFMRLAEQHCDCDLSELFEEQVFGN
jgi:hypothetical protein